MKDTQEGFGTAEALVAAAISLILLSASIGSFTDALGINEKANQMSELEQNSRAGLNMLVRDFMNAGWGIPTGGIPIPSGAGIDAVIRPSSPGTQHTFASVSTVAAVNPGDGMGPIQNGMATDIVNILFADNQLQLNQQPLDAIAADGSNMTVNAAIPISGVRNAIKAGDIIAFSNALGSTMQYVTRVNGQVVYFAAGDPPHLNQRSAAVGSIMQLQSGGAFPPTTATRVWLVSYYLDAMADPEMPRLVRQINHSPGETIALVLDGLQLSYDLVDGVTNPTNIDTPILPNSPNQIRKVNIQLTGRSSMPIQNTGEHLRKSLTTQVSLRSLSFVDRYR